MSTKFCSMTLFFIACASWSITCSAQEGGVVQPKNRQNSVRPMTAATPAVPKWFGLPPVRFQSFRQAPPPTLLQRWAQSTQDAMRKTRNVITAPFTTMSEKMSRVEFFPSTSEDEAPRRGLLSGLISPQEPPPQRISSVTDFLGQPRPE
jgi:hypothetical protein